VNPRKQSIHGTTRVGAFHSMKNSALNFRIFPVTIGTLFTRISGKEDDLVGYTDFSPAISVPFELFPEYPGYPGFPIE